MQHFRMPLWEGRDDVAITAHLTEMPDMPGMSAPKRPAIIVCPGGAYLACSTFGGEGEQISAEFFASGYQVFMLEYTVAMKAGNHPTEYPNALRDLGKAMLTIRSHAEEWSIDVEKIVVCGFSAGGHLVGTLAAFWSAPILADYFHVPSEHFRPGAVIMCYPVADYVVQEQFPYQPRDREAMTESNRVFFGNEHPSQVQLEAMSIPLHITKDTPPIFLVHAADDPLVSPLNALHMAESCVKKNVPCELHLFEQGGHGFGIGNDGAMQWRQDKRRRCGQWVNLALQWLDRQLYPETKESTIIPL